MSQTTRLAMKEICFTCIRKGPILIYFEYEENRLATNDSPPLGKQSTSILSKRKHNTVHVNQLSCSFFNSLHKFSPYILYVQIMKYRVTTEKTEHWQVMSFLLVVTVSWACTATPVWQLSLSHVGRQYEANRHEQHLLVQS